MNYYIEQAIKTLGLLLMLAALAVFAATIGWQVIQFLKHGLWFPVNIFDLVAYFSQETAISIYPDKWKGLAVILEWPHGGFLAMTSMLIPAAAMLGIEEIG